MLGQHYFLWALCLHNRQRDILSSLLNIYCAIIWLNSSSSNGSFLEEIVMGVCWRMGWVLLIHHINRKLTLGLRSDWGHVHKEQGRKWKEGSTHYCSSGFAYRKQYFHLVLGKAYNFTALTAAGELPFNLPGFQVKTGLFRDFFFKNLKGPF